MFSLLLAVANCYDTNKYEKIPQLLWATNAHKSSCHYLLELYQQRVSVIFSFETAELQNALSSAPLAPLLRRLLTTKIAVAFSMVQQKDSQLF